MGFFSSKSSSTTQQFDARAVVDNGGLAATGQGSSVLSVGQGGTYQTAATGGTLNVLDGGAIRAALEFASGADMRIGQLQNSLLDTGRELLGTAAAAVDTSTADRKTLLYVLAAVVAVVVFRGLK